MTESRKSPRPKGPRPTGPSGKSGFGGGKSRGKSSGKSGGSGDDWSSSPPKGGPGAPVTTEGAPAAA